VKFLAFGKITAKNLGVEAIYCWYPNLKDGGPVSPGPYGCCACVYVCCSRVVCLRLKDNLVRLCGMQDVRFDGHLCGVSSANPSLTAGDESAPRRLPCRLFYMRCLRRTPRARGSLCRRERQPRLRDGLSQALWTASRTPPIRRPLCRHLTIKLRSSFSSSDCCDC